MSNFREYIKECFRELAVKRLNEFGLHIKHKVKQNRIHRVAISHNNNLSVD